jgi:phenylalanyl-tRNA synthetase alpha chain
VTAPPAEPLTPSAVDALAGRALAELATCPPAAAALDGWVSRHLGPASALAGCRTRIGALPPPDRAAVGRRLATAVHDLTSAVAQRRRAAPEPPPARPDAGRIDPTCPVSVPAAGGRHPLTALTDEVIGYFARLGFARRSSAQLENATYSFDLLGVPADHPLRTARHSFLTTGGTLLRGHTTASAIRALGEQAGAEATRFVVDGACHRNTVPNARRVTQFHSVEAVATGPRARLSDLKGLAVGLVEELFDGAGTPRLRYHRAVPYVCPGLAVEVDCRVCGCAGCEFCMGTGRVEIAAGGLLTGEVLRAVGTAPGTRGIALSVSLERVLALRHRIGDVRQFLRNDLRVLGQFH